MKFWFKILGVILFFSVFLFFRIDVGETLSVVTGTDPFLFSLAVLLLFPLYALKAHKWKYITEKIGARYPFRRALEIYWVGIFAGVVTPGRIGDFVKVLYLMKETGLNAARSFSTVFMDRLSDISVIVVISVIAGSAFPLLGGYVYLTASLFFIFAALFLVLVCSKSVSGKIYSLLCRFMIPGKYKDKKIKLSDIGDSIFKVRGKSLAVIIAYTIAYWLLFFFQVYVIALSIGLDITFPFLVAAVSISSFLAAIPISVAGIGTRDAVFVLLFGFIGLGSEQAIGFSIMILLLYAITGLIGLLFWLKNG